MQSMVILDSATHTALVYNIDPPSYQGLPFSKWRTWQDNLTASANCGFSTGCSSDLLNINAFASI